MKGKYYIQGSAAISPQESFFGSFTPQMPVVEGPLNRLRAKEPDYSGFITPNNLRRMSRVLKMGLVAALKCLQNSDIAIPDAIVTGTGRGSLQDTERFLHNIRDYAETALNPTPFIQSTYNSVNGLIALQQKCTRYNNTFVHRGFSFEHALLDGMMQLAEGRADVALVGAFDEMTDEHFYIKSRLGMWKTALTQPADLFTSGTTGTLSGEGAAFFTIGTTPGIARLDGIRMVYKPSRQELHAALESFLAQHRVAVTDIDLLISGQNGDTRYDQFYQQLTRQFFPQTAVQYFKPLCGEYETAGAFALWMAVQTLQAQGLQHVLVYNHFFGEQHTFFLLSAV